MVEAATKLEGDLSAAANDVVAPIPSCATDRIAASWAKRGFDTFVATLVLLLFCPLLVAIMVAIHLETGESALVSQKRTGYRGRVFTLYRFRTFAGGGETDPPRRVQPTIIGQLLLALSLDELPQIWNVLRGDMSLVGPRPHEVSDDEAFKDLIARYADRFRARPGLTGLAQISGLRGEANAVEFMRERIAADNSYIDNWSFALDLTILIRTAAVLRDHRA